MNSKSKDTKWQGDMGFKDYVSSAKAIGAILDKFNQMKGKPERGSVSAWEELTKEFNNDAWKQAYKKDVKKGFKQMFDSVKEEWEKLSGKVGGGSDKGDKDEVSNHLGQSKSVSGNSWEPGMSWRIDV